MNNSIQIILTEEEKIQAIKEGLRRQKSNEKNKTKGRNGGAAYGKEALNFHILGAVGEMAVAKHMNMKEHLYKDKEPVRGSYDLPYNIDVKTRSKHSYDLIVQRDESPTKNKKYVLVTIENKKILLHGWMNGLSAIDKKFWYDPRNGRPPAYFIPKDKLKNIETLKEVCN